VTTNRFAILAALALAVAAGSALAGHRNNTGNTTGAINRTNDSRPVMTTIERDAALASKGCVSAGAPGAEGLPGTQSGPGL